MDGTPGKCQKARDSRKTVVALLHKQNVEKALFPPSDHIIKGSIKVQIFHGLLPIFISVFIYINQFPVGCEGREAEKYPGQGLCTVFFPRTL